jgi:MFS family permease
MINKRVKTLLYGSNLWYFGAGMLGPLFAVFAERIGGDILEISWAWATYLIVTGILVIFVGKISDEKISKERLMVVGYALNALFTFGYLLVSSPIHLFLVQAGLGVASALAMPTWESLYAKYEDKRHDGYEWGLAGGEGYILTGIAMVIGGLVVNYLSFKILFITMGTVQIIATVYQSRILKYH